MRAARFRRFLLCLAAWFVGGNLAAARAGEAGRPFLQNFSPRDYGARSQNWAATQDRQGIMYFGNQGVVLQYDGVSWRKIPINQVTDVIRGLDADAATLTAFAGQAGPLGQQTWTRVGQRPDGELLVAGKGGLFRRDATGTNFETAAEYGAEFAGGAFRFDDIAPDLLGNVWFNARPADGLWLEQELGRADAKQPSSATAERQALSHRVVSQVSVVDCVYFDDHFFWMAGPGGLVRLDINAWERASGSPGFATLIRQADASDRSAPDDGSPLAAASKLPYARESVRFTLAANTFGVGAGLRYQTRLSGFGTGGWSGFGQRREVAYTNLPEGFYRFEARARNSDGAVGTLATLKFQVLPPWERTPVAYLGYVLAAGAAVAGIVRWRGRALRVVNVRLEGLVEARTAELRAHEGDLVRAKEVAVDQRGERQEAL